MAEAHTTLNERKIGTANKEDFSGRIQKTGTYYKYNKFKL